ncbi:MAG: transcription-repair coupling factor (superfamily II helicase) [Gammaproteobacteria bacterium]|jgi:transcription-repair coupling factor (superfamily II helicase)
MSDKNRASAFQPECSFKSGEKSFWGRLYGSAKALTVSQLSNEVEAPIVIMTRDSLSASRLTEELRFYLNDNEMNRLLSFPDWETLPYDLFSPYQDIISERLATLTSLPTSKKSILIVPITTLMHRLMPREFLFAHSLILKNGQHHNIDAFRKQLNESGYAFSTQVIEHGDVAIRGSLIDLYPMGAKYPYRIDLLDDEIDSIRTFDPETQRSLNKVDEIRILPAREVALIDEGIARFRSAWRSRFEGNPNQSPVYRDVSQGLAPAGIEYYLPLFYEETNTLFDYLPDECITIFDEDAIDTSESFWEDIETRYEQTRHDVERPVLPPRDMFLNPSDLLSRTKIYHQIHITQREQPERAGVSNYDSMLPASLMIDARSADPLSLFKHFISDFDGRILLVAESAGRRETLLDLFQQHEIKPVQLANWNEFLQGDVRLGLTVAPLEQGAQLDNPRIALISEGQLFGERVMQRRLRKRRQQDSENIVRNLTELTIGAPVVHEEHGVGRYQGLIMLEVGDIPAEFILIEYAEGDKLYVPVSALELISRFTGMDTEHAPLHRLGSGQWQKAKSKAAKRAYDVAAELLELHAQRAARPGFSFELDENAYRAFVQAFPFEETPGQMDAILSVIDDMTQAKPMDRLVCGDAGFGKTEVAMRASFLAIQNNKQVAILVPTTLLAQQHFQNFKDRFADWPVRVELLSRFRTSKEQAIALEGIKDGTVDIVIGTHKLIQGNIEFARLGLLIIDEEHRFGVRQKEKFKAMRAEIDVLTLTATPIPRTLNMALADLREFSIIATPPSKRLAVKTFVREWNDALLKEALLREIKRGGQVYVLHNKVDTIEKMAKQIEALLPEASVRWAHGQMPEKELEQVMLDFYHRRFNVLVCTTIIETGIDVPSANTIIINRADKFGLAQLYQLRGRVGRSHHRAYAYMIVPERKLMTVDAIKRLEAIEALEELGVGFTLATHDLEIRGAGEILGEGQSGQIQEIGYGLYMDLLDRAVTALKSGKQPQLDRPLDHGVEVDLHIPALIPEDYLPDVHMRLIMYKRIASVKDKEALKELQVEMIDRFGLLPEFAKNLLRIAEIKLLVNTLGIRKIDLGPHGGRLQFNKDHNVDPMKIITLIQTNPFTYKLDGQDKLRINEELPEPDDRFTILTNLIAYITNKDAA